MSIYKDLLRKAFAPLSRKASVDGTDSLMLLESDRSPRSTLLSDVLSYISTAIGVSNTTAENALASKSVLVTADNFVVRDSAASNAHKLTTVGNISTYVLAAALAAEATSQRTVGANAALAFVTTDRTIYLTSSTATDKAATTTTSHAGQIIKLYLALASGGSYTIALAGGLTATLNTTGDWIEIVRLADGSAWTVASPGTADIA